MVGTTGGASTTATSTSTGSGPTCSLDAGPPTRAGLKLVLSGSLQADQASAVTYDGKSNLLVAGSFDGAALTFGPALAHVGAPGTDDAWVVKLDPSGAYLWGHAFGGTSQVVFNSAGTDAAGNTIRFCSSSTRGARPSGASASATSTCSARTASR